MTSEAVKGQVFRNSKPANLLLFATVAGLTVHALYALGPATDAVGELASSWAFYGLALLAVGASVARSRTGPRRAPGVDPHHVAFGAWFIGSIYYAAGGSVGHNLYSIPIWDVLLAPSRSRQRWPWACSCARA